MANNDHLFRMEVFCTAKQLGEVIVVLSGRCVQVTTPQLVVNAKAKGGNVTPMSSGNLVEMFSRWIRENNLKEITPQQARQFLADNGRAPRSAGYLFKQARLYGLLKNVARGTWTVHSHVPSKPKLKIVPARKKSARKSKVVSS